MSWGCAGRQGHRGGAVMGIHGEAQSVDSREPVHTAQLVPTVAWDWSRPREKGCGLYRCWQVSQKLGFDKPYRVEGTNACLPAHCRGYRSPGPYVCAFPVPASCFVFSGISEETVLGPFIQGVLGSGSTDQRTCVLNLVGSWLFINQN